MTTFDMIASKLICEKCIALVADRSPTRMARKLGISRTIATRIIRGTMPDWPLSLLLKIAEKYNTNIQYLIGANLSGLSIHPDAFTVAVVTDQAIKRLAKNLTGMTMPTESLKGEFSGYEKPRRKK